MTNANDQAYPLTIFEGGINESGLTKREYFAAMAMQGIVTNTFMEYQGKNPFEVFAKDAVEFADALINELNKPQSK